MKRNKPIHLNVGQVALALACSAGILLMPFFTAWALERPRPGEIERLKAEGKFEESLQRALETGNHKVSPHLIEKFKQKIGKLRGQGLSLSGEAPAPPLKWQGGLPSIGAPKYFVLLIDFADYKHTVSVADINSMIFGSGNAKTNYPYDSLRNWYLRSSYGLLDLENGVTLGWYTTGYNRSSVVPTGEGRENLIKEALNFYHSAGHDFSVYDNDGDGAIDYFIVMWAGPTGSWATFWWPRNLTSDNPSYTLDGKTLRNYSWQPESDRPDTVIHETGHSLGLPDLYDYDDSVGPRGGVGAFDMMDWRWDHNCFSKWMLDWVKPTVVAGSKQDLTLNPSSISTDCVLVWPGVDHGDIFSEFFIVQNRQAEGNDAEPGTSWLVPDGLAIWHVDATLNDTGRDFLYNNSFSDHKLVRLMEADGLEEIERTTWANTGDFYSVGDGFGTGTTPSSAKYNGTDSCVRVWDIANKDAGPTKAVTASFSTSCNQAPTSEAGGPYVAECQGPTTTVPLNGTGSTDPNGDTLTYSWTTNCAGGTFDNPTSALPALTVEAGICHANCSVSLTVTDSGGLSHTDSATITVRDTTPSVIVCPASATVQCNTLTGPGTTGYAAATDVCIQNPLVTYSDRTSPGTCPQASTIARTWTAADGCSNLSSCAQTIRVVDTVGPVISCNSPATMTPVDVPTVFIASATDNCSTPSVQITEYACVGNKSRPSFCTVTLSGSTITIRNSGAVGNRISWTVQSVDGCGNSTRKSCSIDVVSPGKKK